MPCLSAPNRRLVQRCQLAFLQATSNIHSPLLPPTHGDSRGRLQDRIFEFSQGRPSHFLSSLLKGSCQKAKVHQARASILKSRLDFAPVCIRQVRNPGLDFPDGPSWDSYWMSGLGRSLDFKVPPRSGEKVHFDALALPEIK